MGALDEIIRARIQADKHFAKYRDVRKAITASVDTTNSCECATRPGYFWVKEYGLDGGYIQAFNTGVQDRVGMPVLLGIEPQAPFRRVIISIDWGNVPILFSTGESAGSYDYSPHAASHEWAETDPGTDIVNVYQRAIVPIRAQVDSAMRVTVFPGLYMVDDDLKKYQGVTLNLSSYVPSVASTHKRVLLYLTPSTNLVSVQDQTAVVSTATPSYDDPPSNTISVAWVYLQYGDTSLTDSDIVDARPFITGSFSQNTVLTSAQFLKALALVESELDFDISTHVVG